MKENFNFKKAEDFFQEKIQFETNPKELHDFIQNNLDEINIVDVRDYKNYLDGHIPFAIHIPNESIEDNLIQFEKCKMNVIYDQNVFSKNALKTALIASKHNFPTMVMLGGYYLWQKEGYDIVKTDSEQF